MRKNPSVAAAQLRIPPKGLTWISIRVFIQLGVYVTVWIRLIIISYFRFCLKNNICATYRLDNANTLQNRYKIYNFI